MTRIRKILIANRGEIACRIMRTARAMGIATVAIHSDADADAFHVSLADEAVPIGPAPARESYLRTERILAAAKASGADAVHPGYGFLSENAEFAESCARAGLIFIGPPAQAIRKMGLKDEAKRLMTAAGVPVVPGWHGTEQDEAILLDHAREIGFPVLIKAVAGGGGKGMRRVDRESEFPDALKAAKREALNAFGNDHVLLEKFIEKPRHIELQIFADSHGNAVHLFERDCSLQRRHQKVVEEAPAPGMSESLRARMGEAAVSAAKAIGYRGAGTIEFIVDVANGLQDAPFYFMEMNTRLQVEHPVTEAITGEDLVAWQIRVAAGEPLPRRQEELAIAGHAIEVRLYAEDPARDFLPQTGRLALFRLPGDHAGIRIDTGVRAGDAISVHYDPMIAKIIAHGPDRATAIDRLEHALSATRIAGLSTNIAFLRRTIDHPAFRAGDLDTGFIARHIAELMPQAAELGVHHLLAAVAAVLARREAGGQGGALPASGDPWSPWRLRNGFRLNLAQQERMVFLAPSGAEHVLIIHRDGRGSIGVELDGRRYELTFRGRDADGELVIGLDGMRRKVTALAKDEEVTLIDREGALVLRRLSLRAEPEEDAEGPGVVTAPMPGRVLELSVAEGDAVTRDQPLLVLEAMKMEHVLRAPRDGIIAALPTMAGSQVEEGDILVRIAGQTETQTE
ncbi:MAG: acetyl/propionyl/methylcrotonyl-CoA carboxylase subunit alpha [Rhodothalassiaceae bacterium]